MTYDPALSTAIDRMRQALGDISNDAPFAPDETYAALLVEAGGNWKLAAAAMARSFASRAIDDPDSFTAVGDIAVSWTTRAQNWLRIAAALEAQAAKEAEASDNEMHVALPVRADRWREDGEYSNGLRGWR